VDAVQFSPLIPGSASLEDCPDGAFDQMTVAAPRAAVERRSVLASALRVLSPGGTLTALAPKDQGGMRIAGELTEFGCLVEETSRRHHRICRTTRPAKPIGIDDAIAAGGWQVPPALGLWSRPGIFSWDRPDPGSVQLCAHLSGLAGNGADLGCGVGLLARAVLKSATVQRLVLVDVDRRAIQAVERNVVDPRAYSLWRDVREPYPELADLDFVVMNPPFHDGGAEDRALGQAFVRAAAAALKPRGVCWVVANRHLPYERLMTTLFADIRQVSQEDGYKIYEARR
jgi:16S rRNA (guanine1207-N2)-methyltransferase